MTDYTKRSTEEARTEELFGEYLKDDANWSPAKAAVANVFRAMWWASLPVDRINALAMAINNLTEFDAQTTLTNLVKAKVLRSRIERGQRLYEVNY